MKGISLMFLMILIGSLLGAEVFQIGTGTSEQNQAPVNGSSNYSWSKMIYTRTEINATG